MDQHEAHAEAIRSNNLLLKGTYEDGYKAGFKAGREAGMREAAAIVGTMAEGPYDTDPEFNAILDAEWQILAAIGGGK